jgi:LPXTG-motif cell wall-anchored protein
VKGEKAELFLKGEAAHVYLLQKDKGSPIMFTVLGAAAVFMIGFLIFLYRKRKRT